MVNILFLILKLSHTIFLTSGKNVHENSPLSTSHVLSSIIFFVLSILYMYNIIITIIL